VAIDVHVEEKLARHGVAPFEVRQLLQNDYRLWPNRRQRRRIEMIGRTDAGRVLLVAFDPTDEPGVWRPVTAFDAPEKDRRQLP